VAVIKIPVGRKMVALTAYCPDDELGLLACDYVLERVKEILGDGVGEQEFREALIRKDPEYAELFRLLDAGWKLPKNEPFPVDPRNIHPELMIIRHLMREQMEQRGANYGQPLRG